MSTTVSALESWRLDSLDSALTDVQILRSRINDVQDTPRPVANGIPAVWRGTSADRAAAALPPRSADAAQFFAALDLITSALSGLLTSLSTAQADLAAARSTATQHGFVLRQDGTVPAAPPRIIPGQATDTEAQRIRDEHTRDLELRAEVTRQATTALALAGDADAAAAALLRQARGVGDAGTATVAGDPGPIPTGSDPGLIQLWWAGLPQWAQEHYLTRDYATIGNLDGIPLAVRAEANQKSITDRIASDDERLASLRDQLSRAGDPYARAVLQGAIDQMESRLAWYRSLTGADGGTPHQVVLFEPSNQRFAEVVGDLSVATSIGVLVGGTGTNMDTMRGQYDRALDFVGDASPSGALAVITYLGGPMPQDLGAATLAQYAQTIGPRLASFVEGLDRGAGVAVTIVGHSYGGSVVGAAEAAGMAADRVLHVESAGAGPGVSSTADYSSDHWSLHDDGPGRSDCSDSGCERGAARARCEPTLAGWCDGAGDRVSERR